MTNVNFPFQATVVSEGSGGCQGGRGQEVGTDSVRTQTPHPKVSPPFRRWTSQTKPLGKDEGKDISENRQYLELQMNAV